MDKKPITILKTSQNYGLILAGCWIAFSVMQYFSDMHYKADETTVIISYAILSICIILGAVSHKKSNEGFVNLSQTIKIGIGIAMVGTVLFMIYYYGILNTFIDPEVEIKRLNYQKELQQIKMPGQATQGIDRQIEQYQSNKVPFIIIGFIIVSITHLIVALIVSLITGLIIRKSPQT